MFFKLLLFYLDSYSSAFKRLFAVLGSDGSLWLEVLRSEAFLQQYLYYPLQAALREGLVVLLEARSACFGKDRQFLALYAACKRAQAVHFLTAHVRAVVVKLYEVLLCSRYSLLTFLAVIELSLKVAVLLFSLLSECGFTVGTGLFGISLLAQVVGSVVERSQLAVV